MKPTAANSEHVLRYFRSDGFLIDLLNTSHNIKPLFGDKELMISCRTVSILVCLCVSVWSACENNRFTFEELDVWSDISKVRCSRGDLNSLKARLIAVRFCPSLTAGLISVVETGDGSCLSGSDEISCCSFVPQSWLSALPATRQIIEQLFCYSAFWGCQTSVPLQRENNSRWSSRTQALEIQFLYFTDHLLQLFANVKLFLIKQWKSVWSKTSQDLNE